ncbi:Mitochondrial ribonuclease P protein 1-like protein [Armadillidium vulgare]|nr:Mitochondrial ribonuclease P protein 1-like protein [Armadillidium vulgare]
MTVIKSRYCKKVSSKNKNIKSEDKIMLQKYIEMLRYEGRNIPKHLSEEHFQELFELPTKSMRIKFLNYLYERELGKREKKSRKEEKKKLYKMQFEEKQNKLTKHIEYGLWKNSMFIKARKSDITAMYNNRLANAMEFNQPLVIDLDFYDHMKRKEIYSLANQLKLCIVNNRARLEPFNLMMCNCLTTVTFQWNITSKSYLDLFPKEKLIYLTPDARQEMQTFNSDAVYIIGGILDEGRTSPLSLAKAKRENIRTEKLPLDKYHIFRGSKSLDINVVFDILSDIQIDGLTFADFQEIGKKLVKNIPRRLLQTADRIPSHPNKMRRF